MPHEERAHDQDTSTRAQGGLPQSAGRCLPDEAATAALAPELARQRGRRRSRHAVGRSRLRQDELCPGADPRAHGDPSAGSAEPHLHADAGYEGPRFPIVHADLYRIGSADELAELGWEEAAEGSLVLVEWPERAGFLLTAERLDVALELDPENGDPARASPPSRARGRCAADRDVRKRSRRCSRNPAGPARRGAYAGRRLDAALRAADEGRRVHRAPDGGPRAGRTVRRSAPEVLFDAGAARDQRAPLRRHGGALLAQGLSAPGSWRPTCTRASHR